MNKDQIVIYDIAPSTFSESTAVQSIPYRLLSSAERYVLRNFYEEEWKVSAYNRQPPQSVVNIIAQMKLNSDVKDMIVMEEPSFPKEAMLLLITPPVKGTYSDRTYLIARWSLDDEHKLSSLDDIRIRVKQRLMMRRRELLSAALSRVEFDVEEKMNSDHDCHVTFDK